MSTQTDYDEARAKLGRLRDELEALNATADADGNLTPERQRRWADTKRAAEKASVELDAARDKYTRDIERIATSGRAGSIEHGSPQPVQHMRRVDPDDPNTDMRSRALAQAEGMQRMSSEFAITDHAIERSVELVERGADDPHLTGIEQHTLVLSDPDYARACQKYFRDPMMGTQLFTPEEARAFSRARAFGASEVRAAMSLTGANGGVMVPHFLDPSIQLTNSGANNPLRQISDVVPITTTTWEGVSSAGVSAEWLAEATEAADASPTFAGPTITTKKAAAWLYGSYEVLADSGFNEVAMLIQDARDRLEEAAFTNGNGVTQPLGVISAFSGTGPLVAGTSGAAGAADFVMADIYAMKNALSPRFRRNASWMANPAIWDRVRQFGNATSGTNAANFWVELGADTPPSLLGKPVYENESMDGTVVSGSDDLVLLAGDFKEWKIIDRLGVVMLYNPLVIGSSQRPVGQAGWFSYWRTGSGISSTSNAFRLLKL